MTTNRPKKEFIEHFAGFVKAVKKSNEIMNTDTLLIYYLLGINGVTFALYGIDKLKSQKGWWRIPEKTLLLFAVIGGSVGALVWDAVVSSQDKT